MKREPAIVFEPPEYARPVIPAGLTEDQEDELLAQMMQRLMGERHAASPPASTSRHTRLFADEGPGLGDDVVEF
jgi:hypothetical protein